MGDVTVCLAQLLQHYNGKFDNLELNMDLMYESKSESRQRSKVGELVVVLSGLRIDMTNVQVPTTNDVNREVRARMRLRGAAITQQGSPNPVNANGITPAMSTVSLNNGSPGQMTNSGVVVGGPAPPPQAPSSTGAIRRSGMNWDQPTQQQSAAPPEYPRQRLGPSMPDPQSAVVVPQTLPPSVPPQQQLPPTQQQQQQIVQNGTIGGVPIMVANNGETPQTLQEDNEPLPVSYYFIIF